MTQKEDILQILFTAMKQLPGSVNCLLPDHRKPRYGFLKSGDFVSAFELDPIVNMSPVNSANVQMAARDLFISCHAR